MTQITAGFHLYVISAKIPKNLNISEVLNKKKGGKLFVGLKLFLRMIFKIGFSFPVSETTALQTNFE